MSHQRLRLWHNILEDLGPGDGYMLPWWLIVVYFILFPLGGVQWLIFERTGPYNIYDNTWTIHGQVYTDQFFRLMAIADEKILNVERINGIVTLTINNNPENTTPLPAMNNKEAKAAKSQLEKAIFLLKKNDSPYIFGTSLKEAKKQPH